MSDFKKTRWSLIQRVGDPKGPDFRADLEELCRDFYEPLLDKVRRSTRRDEQQARDVVQRLILDLCARGVHPTDPGRKSFRSWLENQAHNHLRTLKRQDRRYLAVGDDEGPGYDGLHSPADAPDRLFDAQCGLAAVARASLRLEKTESALDHPARFRRVRSILLSPDRDDAWYAGAAAELDMNVSTLRSYVSRLRKSLRQLARDDIARHVQDEAQIDEELQTLHDALAVRGLFGPAPLPLP